MILTSAGRLEGSGCSGDAACTLTTLSSGAERSFEVHLGDATPGPLPLAIEVTSATSDPNARNNRAAATVDVVRAPRLTLSLYGGIADPGAPVE